MTLKELLDERDRLNSKIAALMEPVNLAQGELTVIDAQINAIITEPVQHVRLATGKDTGTVECLVQGVMVKSQTTKVVVWDQEKLAALRERIAQHNDDPDAYMKTKTPIQSTRSGTKISRRRSRRSLPMPAPSKPLLLN